VGSILSTFVWTICTHGADQVAAQRYLSTASAREAGRTVWIYSFCSVAMVGLLMLAGVALFFLEFAASGLPVQAFQAAVAPGADKVLPRFIASSLPAGMSGLLLAALLAAAMSSLSSGINAISAVATTDFVQRFGLAPRTAGVGLAIALAGLTGAVGMAAGFAVTAFMARGTWNLVELMERVNHLFVAPLAALFFVGLISKRASASAAVAGFVAGLATSVLIAFSGALFGLQPGISFVWIMPASLVAGLLVALAIPGPRHLETPLEGVRPT
jgi:SSS family solute:Na+ symporter